MSALPPSSDYTGSTITQGQKKAFMTAVRNFLSGLLGQDGLPISALRALGALFASSGAKTTAYTVVAADRGKMLLCSGTWTLSFDDAAALGDGFAVAIKNVGSGSITLDAYLTQQVDGATTVALPAGQSAVVVCDGTALRTIGRGAVVTVNGVAPDAAGNVVVPADFVKLASGSVTNQSSIDISLASWLSTYRTIEIDIYSPDALRLVTSTDGGSTWESSGYSGVKTTLHYDTYNGGSATASSVGSSYLSIGGSPMQARISLNKQQASDNMRIDWKASAGTDQIIGFGVSPSSTAVNAVRLKLASGNITSANYTIYGRK